jgi:hypothetical protein
MVQPFKEWVEKRRNHQSGRKRISEQDSLAQDIDDLISEAGTGMSCQSSAPSGLLVRKVPTVLDARVQRLESELLRVTAELERLTFVVQKLVNIVGDSETV